MNSAECLFICHCSARLKRSGMGGVCHDHLFYLLVPYIVAVASRYYLKNRVHLDTAIPSPLKAGLLGSTNALTVIPRPRLARSLLSVARCCMCLFVSK